MSLLNMIVPVIVSAALTALMVPLIIRFSYRRKLFDTVDERTVHSGVVPRLGGSAFILSVVLAVFVAVVMWDAEHIDCGLTAHSGWLEYGALCCAALIIYVSGLWDDVKRIDYKVKFACQFISAMLIVVVGNFWINDFYGLFGLGQLSPLAGKTFSVLLIMYVINAFNLIDGIDGLASALGIITTTVIGTLFIMSGQPLMAVLSFALAASLIVFFFYNKFGRTENHTKIFMGDGGSQTMGLIIAFLVIFMSMRMPGEGDVPLQSPVVSFCLIIIPCFDAVRVMVGRMLRGKNPFLPDMTHIHHKFLRIGYSVTRTLAAIMVIDLLFVAVNIVLTVADTNMCAGIKINLILCIDIVIWLCLHWWLNSRIRKVEAGKTDA